MKLNAWIKSLLIFLYTCFVILYNWYYIPCTNHFPTTYIHINKVVCFFLCHHRAIIFRCLKSCIFKFKYNNTVIIVAIITIQQQLCNDDDDNDNDFVFILFKHSSFLCLFSLLYVFHCEDVKFLCSYLTLDLMFHGKNIIIWLSF